MQLPEFIQLCKGKRFSFDNENIVQAELQALLINSKTPYIREYKMDHPILSFDGHNIPDFFFEATGLCVEIKIKGSKKEIYRQLLRYSEFEQVKTIVLLTNKSMALPITINDKPTAIINMGLAWL